MAKPKRKFYWVAKSAKTGLWVSPVYAKRYPSRVVRYKVFYG